MHLVRNLFLVLGDQLDLEAAAFNGFDADNCEAFGPQGPGPVPARATFEPDALTQEVIELVNTRLNVARMTGSQKQAVTHRANAIRRGEVGVAQ